MFCDDGVLNGILLLLLLLVCLVVRRCGVLLVLFLSFSPHPGMFLEVTSSDCFVRV